jgi:hypothetical protein
MLKVRVRPLAETRVGRHDNLDLGVHILDAPHKVMSLFAMKHDDLHPR